MGVEEFRETLEMDDVFIRADGDDNVIIQKRINLQSGKRHTLMAVDFMDDSFVFPTNVTAAYEFFISPYPIIPTNMRLGELWTQRGPLGSDDAILFKQASTNVRNSPGPNGVFTQRMPNETLGSLPTYVWYTPSLYLTLILHNEPDTGDWFIDDLAMSVYMAVNSVDVSAAEYGIGMIREYSNAQTRSVMANGREIKIANQAGQSFPMWQAGGRVAERMIAGDVKSDWFIRGALNEAESAQDTASLQTFMRLSSVMQPFDVARGSGSVAKGQVPDWVRFSLARSNLFFGLEREQFPPTVKNETSGSAGLGNTVMV